jgi:ATP-dependent RNA helicase DHX37/DHR1
MLSVEEQARVFDKVPEGVRLIVVATNIAETSITIPDISYVVDSGRQKCRNYHAGTGVASYDVMWISRAAADQRAGRAGRTGPGHCYRMFSSSMYSRHMSAFALPEVLTRPLEDVVLAMKAMQVLNVANFPFPTAPDQGQLDAAVKVLANIGCVDLSNIEKRGGDGEITRLGGAVAKLPLGVRYGKMLLVAAQAGMLDYGIVIVAVQSESSPFQHWSTEENGRKEDSDNDEDFLDEVDRNSAEKKEEKRKNQAKSKWIHRGGDILAAAHAVGAYTYAGRGAGGGAEKAACRRFCEENGLHPLVLERIQKLRIHLARLAKIRLSNAKGIAAKTGGILSTMPPPNKQQENRLLQVSAIVDVGHVQVILYFLHPLTCSK